MPPKKKKKSEGGVEHPSLPPTVPGSDPSGNDVFSFLRSANLHRDSSGQILPGQTLRMPNGRTDITLRRPGDGYNNLHVCLACFEKSGGQLKGKKLAKPENMERHMKTCVHIGASIPSSAPGPGMGFLPQGHADPSSEDDFAADEAELGNDDNSNEGDGSSSDEEANAEPASSKKPRRRSSRTNDAKTKNAAREKKEKKAAAKQKKAEAAAAKQKDAGAGEATKKKKKKPNTELAASHKKKAKTGGSNKGDSMKGAKKKKETTQKNKKAEGEGEWAYNGPAMVTGRDRKQTVFHNITTM